MGSLVSEETDREDLKRYFNALRHAQREIDLEAERCKHRWLHETADDLREGIDVLRFGPGERIVFEPYTRRCSSARTVGWKAGSCSTPARAVRPAYEDAVLT
jgi:NitT/TauT family transport system substrate-binding protein